MGGVGSGGRGRKKIIGVPRDAHGRIQHPPRRVCELCQGPAHGKVCKCCYKKDLKKDRAERSVCACGGAKSPDASRCRPCAHVVQTAQRNADRIKRRARTCIGCGASFQKRPNRNAGKYCSRACAFKDPKRHLRIAKTQHSDWQARPPVVAFRKASRSAVHRALKSWARAIRRDAEAARRATVHQRTCKVCGQSFQKPPLVPGLHNLCSDACRLVASREASRRTRLRLGTKPAERARRRGLPYEKCGPIAVCTRDNWHCQICGVSTPRKLRGTYEMRAPEVDHIIPLSAPGSPGHVWSNVQCACRCCNLSKGATIIGQLRLAV